MSATVPKVSQCLNFGPPIERASVTPTCESSHVAIEGTRYKIASASCPKLYSIVWIVYSSLNTSINTLEGY